MPRCQVNLREGEGHLLWFRGRMETVDWHDETADPNHTTHSIGFIFLRSRSLISSQPLISPNKTMTHSQYRHDPCLNIFSYPGESGPSDDRMTFSHTIMTGAYRALVTSPDAAVYMPSPRFLFGNNIHETAAMPPAESRAKTVEIISHVLQLIDKEKKWEPDSPLSSRHRQ